MSYVRYYTCPGCGHKADSAGLNLDVTYACICDLCHKEIDGPIVTCASPIEAWKHVKAMGDHPTPKLRDTYHYHSDCVKKMLDKSEEVK